MRTWQDAKGGGYISHVMRGGGQGFLSQADKSFRKHKACDKQAQADVTQAMLRGQESSSAPLF